MDPCEAMGSRLVTRPGSRLFRNVTVVHCFAVVEDYTIICHQDTLDVAQSQLNDIARARFKWPRSSSPPFFWLLIQDENGHLEHEKLQGLEEQTE